MATRKRAKKKAKRPRGRPTTYTQAIASRILAQMADGESLRAICRDEAMPKESTVRGWVIDDLHGFAAQYTRAREIQWQGRAEAMLEIADDGRNDTYMDDAGRARVDYDNIHRSRLRVDTLKWLLSKLLPKEYGDKVSHAGPDGGPIPVQATVYLPANGRP